MTNFAAISQFWQELGRRYSRAGAAGKRRTPIKKAHRLKGAETPSELAAHRAALERDYFRGNPERLRLIREAAIEFDAYWVKYAELRRRNKKAKAAAA